jgi:hypothetical protein
LPYNLRLIIGIINILQIKNEDEETVLINILFFYVLYNFQPGLYKQRGWQKERSAN